MSGLKTVFATTLTEVGSNDVEGIGQVRVEADPILGVRKFRWVRNKSGGSLAVNSVAGWEAGMAALVADTNTDTLKVVDSAMGATAGEFVGYWVRVLDDVGGAGAAPEGEVRKIVANGATELTVDTAFTAAVTAGDTVQVYRPWHIVAAADAMVAAEVAGVLMATLADNKWGWVQFAGINLNTLVVAVGTTLVAGAALKVAAGILVVAGDAADNGEVVAANVFAVTTDTVLRTAVVKWALTE
jgi:hypothetical protein